MTRKIIVTSSLPYANGEIHLGHMLEYVQTDMWARFQRMRGNQCYYVCGSDAHGTPIMLRAEKDNTSPEELVKTMREKQLNAFENFHVHFDVFHSTHSPENQHFTELVYKRLKENGDILQKTIEQAYDPIKKMFLPDRFVKGNCPCCKARDQYGDSCEACGATYTPLKMGNPVSVLTGETPVAKASEHFFFDLNKHHDFLKSWLEAGHVQKPIANKLAEWFKEGLQAWDISRDAPYFGFKIPGTEDKYFYVWLDAPIGYMASFSTLAHNDPNVDFDDYWDPNTESELYHFVGKDVVYFHSLFWPAILKSTNFRLPTAIHAHGFLTVDGQKMSKSRGTFITAEAYLKYFDPECLRYYFASKMTPNIEDIDLSLDDFKQKVNSDLVGKLINIASRASSFITKHFDNRLSPAIHQPELLEQFINAGETLAEYYENRQFSTMIREVMHLADIANQYFSDQAPWKMIKEAEKKAEAHEICTLAINLFRILMVYLQPVLPELAKKSAEFLNITPFIWHDSTIPLLDHEIQTYQPLLTRIEDKAIKKLKEETIMTTDTQNTPKPPAEKPEQNKFIGIEDFAKIDLRVAKIIHAESVPEADKLIKIQLDLGEEKPRQVFAGIKSAYTPETLIGKHVVCVANLQPRKMRFGLSEGMVLCCSDDTTLLLVTPEEQDKAKPGMKVK